MKAKDYMKELIEFLKKDGYTVDVADEEHNIIFIIHPYGGQEEGGVAEFVEIHDVNSDLGDVVELETSMVFGFDVRKTDKELICLRDRIAQTYGVHLIKFEKGSYVVKMRNICCDMNTLKAAVSYHIPQIFNALRLIGIKVVYKK